MKIVALFLFVCSGAFSQNPVRAWRTQHEEQILSEYLKLLAIPNVAADRTDLQKNADTLMEMLNTRHVAAQLLTMPNVPPIVFGEIKTPAAKRTIVLYAHYDGQPVTPADWDGGDPFKPVFREVNGERRIYARSASDDKAAIFAQLMALDALQASHIPLKANIKFVWEGEEEAGSPHLEEMLNGHRDLIHGDVFLICDGPVDQSRQQTIAFGARGDTHLEITVYGPKRELHSGHYGNWAPNPALMLVQLLARMKDENGHVLIPHFYDSVKPLSETEKRALQEAPVNDAKLMEELWLGHVEGGGKHLLELLNLPTLNINGISSGRTGARANNVIPATAIADLDLRLVVGVDWRGQQQKVIDYVKAQGYTVVESEPNQETLLKNAKVAYVKRDSGYNAVRTSMDLPISEDVIQAVESAHKPVIKLPTMGGSVPLEGIERATGTHTITIPIANHDNNQHSANENIRVQNLWDGIETMAALLEMR
jgi:acetylornithine deacetylase/succinyl-diaminopimelate desuccinylase-like protein